MLCALAHNTSICKKSNPRLISDSKSDHKSEGLGLQLTSKELHVFQVENTTSTQHKAVLDVLQIKNHIADNKQFYIRMFRNTGSVSREPIKIACVQPRSICALNTMQLWIIDPNENKGLEMEQNF